MSELKNTAPEGGKKRPGAERKAMLLRLNSHLWDELAAWSEEEFRSVNGQIEYILTEAVRRRRGHKPE